jgi:hypothetical protein
MLPASATFGEPDISRMGTQRPGPIWRRNSGTCALSSNDANTRPICVARRSSILGSGKQFDQGRLADSDVALSDRFADQSVAILAEIL